VEELHRALLEVGFRAGDDLGLVLAGGYALTAHDLLRRSSHDIDFATATMLPMPVVVFRLAQAYRNAGYQVDIIESTQRMARLTVSTPEIECEVDILKEAIGPPARLRIGPVLAFEDAVGLKMRALHERAAHRDYIDIRAASARLSRPDLEAFGARHTPGFSLEELADRLGAIGERSRAGFTAYGLDDVAIGELQTWAVHWESDIRLRLAAGETGPVALPDDDWEAYLDPAD
jgi:hypothetical protein